MSKMRKNYFLRLICRSLIFLFCVAMYIIDAPDFAILEGMNFFSVFSVFHLMWAIWVVDMILQIVPLKNRVPLGSQKLWKNRFRPMRGKINFESLRSYIISTTKSAYKVFCIWCVMLTALGFLYYADIITQEILFLISVCFYLCDLICVLIWCPFRLILKNRCCTTCRIFNWDHLMMFSPLVFVGGFFCTSLVILALLAWLIWELCVMMYPERFWEHSNAALKCSACTDKLCTQYCRKLR